MFKIDRVIMITFFCFFAPFDLDIKKTKKEPLKYGNITDLNMFLSLIVFVLIIGFLLFDYFFPVFFFPNCLNWEKLFWAK